MKKSAAEMKALGKLVAKIKKLEIINDGEIFDTSSPEQKVVSKYNQLINPYMSDRLSANLTELNNELLKLKATIANDIDPIQRKGKLFTHLSKNEEKRLSKLLDIVNQAIDITKQFQLKLNADAKPSLDKPAVIAPAAPPLRPPTYGQAARAASKVTTPNSIPKVSKISNTTSSIPAPPANWQKGSIEHKVAKQRNRGRPLNAQERDALFKKFAAEEEKAQKNNRLGPIIDDILSSAKISPKGGS